MCVAKKGLVHVHQRANLRIFISLLQFFLSGFHHPLALGFNTSTPKEAFSFSFTN